ncbi:MAG: glutamyl-tRNA reductase [Gammaproteobacteria bacterium]|nr:glutamyl-tRNA reductase [Gammaproteobacteria bacterium]
MAILAYGINYRTAPINVRERIAFTAEELLSDLTKAKRSIAGVREVVIISTCNRTELIVSIDSEGRKAVEDWLCSYRTIRKEELEQLAYAYWNQSAAEHLIKVSSGLDSQVLGEPQILGQIKNAYEVARLAGTLGPELNLLSQITINWAKKVRSETGIGENPVSVAYAAVVMAQQIFSSVKNKMVLLVGAGDTISRVGEHLRELGIKNMVVANRTLMHAEALAEKLDGQASTIDAISGHLHNFDMIIASTGSSSHVLGLEKFQTAAKKRKNRPVFIVDLAVPRDIDPAVDFISNIYLYTIDDLTDIIQENINKRKVQAIAANEIAASGASAYMQESRMRQHTDLLKTFRNSHTSIAREEETKALNSIAAGEDPSKVISELAHNLTNKLIHQPTVAIRDASASNRNDLLEFIKDLYELDK